MAQSWCKVSSDLDMHPKVRRAGNLGRQVFEFALRRNAALDMGGAIPADYFEPEYLAIQLMITEDEARHGLSRSVTAGLLRRDGDVFVILGWDDEWAKRPLTEAERQARRRSKVKVSNNIEETVTKPSRPESDCPDSHVREEKRREEKRERPPAAADQLDLLKAKVDAATGEVGKQRNKQAEQAKSNHRPLVDAFHEYYVAITGGSKPSWTDKTIGMAAELVRKHGADEAVKRVRKLRENPPKFPPQPWDFPTFVSHFDKCVTATRTGLFNGEKPRVIPKL